jgi:hypothetical protein
MYAARELSTISTTLHRRLAAEIVIIEGAVTSVAVFK